MVIFHCTLYNSQTDTSALIFMTRMQAVKKLKDLFSLRWVKANSIIADLYYVIHFLRGKRRDRRTGSRMANMNNRLVSGSLKLQGIADQVLEELAKLSPFSRDGREY